MRRRLSQRANGARPVYNLCGDTMMSWLDHGFSLLLARLMGTHSISEGTRCALVSIGASLLLLAGCAGSQLRGPAATLHRASQSGDLHEVRAIVTAQPALLDSRESRGGNTPLAWAVFHGHLELVQYLVRQGADIETRNSDGYRPLHAAASRNHEEIARFLIEEGADIEAAPRFSDDTPLAIAAAHGSPDVLQLLLSRGARVVTGTSFPPLHYVAGDGFTSFVDLMLAKGAPVNEADINGKTPLHWAVRAGYLSREDQAAQRFYGGLRHGARREPEKWPREPLLVVESLLASGADVNAKSRFAETPLHVAAEAGRPEIARLLLRHGAQPNARERYGFTPLYFAADHGRGEMVRVLLEHGAEVNVAGRHGWTPLHTAADKGHGRGEMVRVLLEHGAEVNAARGKIGWTPLHEAAANGHVRESRLLIESGADVDARADSGKTPLIYAATRGHEEVVVLLVESGADVNVKFRECDGDRSTLYWPRKKGYTNIVRFLESHGAE